MKLMMPFFEGSGQFAFLRQAPRASWQPAAMIDPIRGRGMTSCMTTAEYRLGYRGDIEGLRAVAISLVIGAHAGVPWLAGGFVGVDVFFVLSGFLITGLLLQEVANNGEIRFLDFYLRRLRRLLPALLFMLIVTSLAAFYLLAPSEQLDQSKAAAAAAFWVSNIHFALAQLDYFSAGSESNLFLHTWSLGVEEQFYLLWPALMLWALGRGKGLVQVKQLRQLMIGVAVLSAAACLLLTPSLPHWAFYMMPMRAWQFAVGALIWLYCCKEGAAVTAWNDGARSAAPKAWLGWIGLAAVLAAGILLGPGVSYPGWRAWIPTCGAAAVVVAGLGGRNRGAAALLAWRPLQAIGRVSYSWYLWHWPVLLLGYAAFGSRSPWLRAAEVLISLLLALASYKFVEKPIRHQRYWMTHRRMALLGSVAMMTVTCFLAMDWCTEALLKTRSPDSQRYATAYADAPVIYGMGCDDWYRTDHVLMCTFGKKDATHTAVLMGDSIAGQWFPAFADIFQRPGWRLIVLTKSSCPMVDEPIFLERIGREFTECSTWRSRALEQVASIKPDVVVLGTGVTNGFTKEQWIKGTSRILAALTTKSGHIYLMRGTPHLAFDGPNCLASHAGRPEWLRSWQACSSLSSDEHEQHVFEWLQQAGEGFANVQAIDMNDLVCPHEQCSAELKGRVVFRDSQHLTASFARELAPEVDKRMGSYGPGAPGPDGATATLQ